MIAVTWRRVLPGLLIAAEAGNSAARVELERMADLADHYVTERRNAGDYPVGLVGDYWVGYGHGRWARANMAAALDRRGGMPNSVDIVTYGPDWTSGYIDGARA